MSPPGFQYHPHCCQLGDVTGLHTASKMARVLIQWLRNYDMFITGSTLLIVIPFARYLEGIKVRTRGKISIQAAA